MRRFPTGRLAVLPLTVVGWLVLAVTSTPVFADTSGADTAAANVVHANPAAPGQLMQQTTAPSDATATNTTTPAAAPTTAADTSMGTAGTFGDATQPQPLSGADLNPGGANNGGDCGAYCSTRNGDPSLNGNGTSTTSGKPCAGCVGRADNKNPPGQQPNGSDHNQGYECDGNNGIGQSNPAHTSCLQPAVPTQTDCSSSPGGCPQSDCSSSPGGCLHSDCSSSPGGCLHSDCSSSPGGCSGGGQCTAPTACGGVVPCATSMSSGAACGQSNPAPGAACIPTQDNSFCTTVEGEHITRTVTTKTTLPRLGTPVSPPQTATPPTAPRVPTVIGEKLVRTPPPAAALPFTGLPVDRMLAIAIVALAAGGLLVRVGRRTTPAGPIG